MLKVIVINIPPAETTQLLDEIDRIANSTEYAGSKLIDGTTTDVIFQVGAADSVDY